jgi:phosphoadenosine phosphosulfate reductase
LPFASEEKYVQMNFSEVQHQLESLSPQNGLHWLSENFGKDAKFSSSFGLEDQVIAHWIGSGKLAIEVFTLDTGRLFQETYDLVALTTAKYDLPVRTFYPDTKQVEQLVSTKGPNSFYDSVDNRKECCQIRKVVPLKRALEGARVWITGIRADQSGNRQSMEVVTWDETYKLIKYNPLLHWSIEQIEEFIASNKVPVNSLHRRGYPSIGCAPCTRAIAPGEDLRAGRWWWETSAKECGLHAVEEKENKNVVG